MTVLRVATRWGRFAPTSFILERKINQQKNKDAIRVKLTYCWWKKSCTSRYGNIQVRWCRISSINSSWLQNQQSFDDIYQERWAFSKAMLVYPRVFGWKFHKLYITFHWFLWNNEIHDDQPCLLSQDLFVETFDFKGGEATVLAGITELKVKVEVFITIQTAMNDVRI